MSRKTEGPAQNMRFVEAPPFPSGGMTTVSDLPAGTGELWCGENVGS